MKPLQVKVIGAIAAAIVILNLFLFALRIISSTIFWIVIVTGATFAYFVLPRLKKLP